MLILSLVLAGVALLIMSFALKNASDLQKLATFQRNYPKMVEYQRMSTILVIGITILVCIVTFIMVSCSYNFYSR
jgi:hypothetical protein